MLHRFKIQPSTFSNAILGQNSSILPFMCTFQSSLRRSPANFQSIRFFAVPAKKEKDNTAKTKVKMAKKTSAQSNEKKKKAGREEKNADTDAFYKFMHAVEDSKR